MFQRRRMAPLPPRHRPSVGLDNCDGSLTRTLYSNAVHTNIRVSRLVPRNYRWLKMLKVRRRGAEGNWGSANRCSGQRVPGRQPQLCRPILGQTGLLCFQPCTGALSVPLELNNVPDKFIGMKKPFNYFNYYFWSLVKKIKNKNQINLRPENQIIRTLKVKKKKKMHLSFLLRCYPILAGGTAYKLSFFYKRAL